MWLTYSVTQAAVCWRDFASARCWAGLSVGTWAGQLATYLATATPRHPAARMARATAIALVAIRDRRARPPAAGLGPAARPDVTSGTGLTLRPGSTAGPGWLTGSGRTTRLAAGAATPLSAGADAIAGGTDSARSWSCRGWALSRLVLSRLVLSWPVLSRLVLWCRPGSLGADRPCMRCRSLSDSAGDADEACLACAAPRKRCGSCSLRSSSPMWNPSLGAHTGRCGPHGIAEHRIGASSSKSARNVMATT